MLMLFSVINGKGLKISRHIKHLIRKEYLSKGIVFQINALVHNLIHHLITFPTLYVYINRTITIY